VPTTFDIPPMSGKAFTVQAGQSFRVIDTDGQQVADLVAFSQAEPATYLSQGFTRMMNDSTLIGAGQSLYSNLGIPMLTITDDPVGRHDLLYPPCNEVFYAGRGISGKTGCREHLAVALAEYQIPFSQITDPFNVFMHSQVRPDGTPEVLLPFSKAGDHIELRAEIDLIVGVSACAADIGLCNGESCTSILISTDL
jgi:uncharacterized protein YcgI (DUF1989 family)